MKKKYIIDEIKDNDLVLSIKKYKDEIKNENISLQDIEDREQNFLYIGDLITDNVYNKFGAKYLYNILLKDDINTDYEDLDEDEFNSIWWNTLDLVEDYILRVVENNE